MEGARYVLVDSENASGTHDQLTDVRFIVNYELQFNGSDLQLAVN